MEPSICPFPVQEPLVGSLQKSSFRRKLRKFALNLHRGKVFGRDGLGKGRREGIEKGACILLQGYITMLPPSINIIFHPLRSEPTLSIPMYW